jgi:hypothetical protein
MTDELTVRSVAAKFRCTEKYLLLVPMSHQCHATGIWSQLSCRKARKGYSQGA